MTDTLVIQRATAADAARITEHRRLMFTEEGVGDPTNLAASLPLFTPWLEERLIRGEYIGLIAFDGETAAASAGLWRMPFPPGPLNQVPERAYILNVYTDPAYRRRGLAKKLVSSLLDEARTLGLHVVELHASSAGRPIYEGLGFKATNQMRLFV
jgi:ribosomal protein S18 acetylase RimI-like enzyme